MPNPPQQKQKASPNLSEFYRKSKEVEFDPKAKPKPVKPSAASIASVAGGVAGRDGGRLKIPTLSDGVDAPIDLSGQYTYTFNINGRTIPYKSKRKLKQYEIDALHHEIAKQFGVTTTLNRRAELGYIADEIRNASTGMAKGMIDQGFEQRAEEKSAKAYARRRGPNPATSYTADPRSEDERRQGRFNWLRTKGGKDLKGLSPQEAYEQMMKEAGSQVEVAESDSSVFDRYNNKYHDWVNSEVTPKYKEWVKQRTEDELHTIAFTPIAVGAVNAALPGMLKSKGLDKARWFTDTNDVDRLDYGDLGDQIMVDAAREELFDRLTNRASRAMSRDFPGAPGSKTVGNFLSGHAAGIWHQSIHQWSQAGNTADKLTTQQQSPTASDYINLAVLPLVVAGGVGSAAKVAGVNLAKRISAWGAAAALPGKAMQGAAWKLAEAGGKVSPKLTESVIRGARSFKDFDFTGAQFAGSLTPEQTQIRKAELRGDPGKLSNKFQVAVANGLAKLGATKPLINLRSDLMSQLEVFGSHHEFGPSLMKQVDDVTKAIDNVSTALPWYQSLARGEKEMVESYVGAAREAYSHIPAFAEDPVKLEHAAYISRALYSYQLAHGASRLTPISFEQMIRVVDGGDPRFLWQLEDAISGANPIKNVVEQVGSGKQGDILLATAREIESRTAGTAPSKPLFLKAGETGEVLTPDEITAHFADNTRRELDALFNKLPPEEIEKMKFYGRGVDNANSAIDAHIRKVHGVKPAGWQRRLVHLFSAMASPQMDPFGDTAIGLGLFDAAIRGPGDLDKIIWSMERKAPSKAATEAGDFDWVQSQTGIRGKAETSPEIRARDKASRGKPSTAFGLTAMKRFRNIVNALMKGNLVEAGEHTNLTRQAAADINLNFRYKTSLEAAVDLMSSELGHNARIGGNLTFEELDYMARHGSMPDLDIMPKEFKKVKKAHEYSGDTTRGIFVLGEGFAKVGSYYLNRTGDLSTVTKDFWFARAVARIFGQELTTTSKSGKSTALKTMFSKTARATEIRKALDRAYEIVGDEFGLKPAEVQELTWGIERMLYEQGGVKLTDSSMAQGASTAAKYLGGREGEAVSRKILSEVPHGRALPGMIRLRGAEAIIGRWPVGASKPLDPDRILKLLAGVSAEERRVTRVDSFLRGAKLAGLELTQDDMMAFFDAAHNQIQVVELGPGETRYIAHTPWYRRPEDLGAVRIPKVEDREFLYRHVGSSYKETHWRGYSGVYAHARAGILDGGDVHYVHEIQARGHSERSVSSQLAGTTRPKSEREVISHAVYDVLDELYELLEMRRVGAWEAGYEYPSRGYYEVSNELYRLMNGGIKSTIDEHLATPGREPFHPDDLVPPTLRANDPVDQMISPAREAATKTARGLVGDIVDKVVGGLPAGDAKELLTKHLAAKKKSILGGYGYGRRESLEVPQALAGQDMAWASQVVRDQVRIASVEGRRYIDFSDARVPSEASGELAAAILSVYPDGSIRFERRLANYADDGWLDGDIIYPAGHPMANVVTDQTPYNAGLDHYWFMIPPKHFSKLYDDYVFNSMKKLYLASGGQLDDISYAPVYGSRGGAIRFPITSAMRRKAVMEGVFFQESGGGQLANGLYSLKEDLIKLSSTADIHTVIHEHGHALRAAVQAIGGKQAEMLLKLFGEATSVEGQEAFARAVEKFFYTGEAPAPEYAGVFGAIKAWMGEIYAKAAPDAEVNPEVQKFLNSVFAQSKPDKKFLSSLRKFNTPAALPQGLVAGIKDKATLDDFKGQGVTKALEKDDWAILTAENPGAKASTEAENAAANAELKRLLDEEGIEYKPTTGRYSDEGGAPENGFLVVGVPEAKALEIGRKFNQEAITTRRGLVYVEDGSANPATGVTVHDVEPANYYTTVDGDTHFSLDIDFDRREPGPGGTGKMADSFNQVVGSTPTPSTTAIKLQHYGPAGVSETDPSLMGTGKAARSDEQLNKVKGTWFYPEGVAHEKRVQSLYSGSAHSMYDAEIDSSKIYDITEDKLGLIKKTADETGIVSGPNLLDEVNVKLRDLGYSGIRNEKRVFVWEPVKLTRSTDKLFQPADDLANVLKGPKPEEFPEYTGLSNKVRDWEEELGIASAGMPKDPAELSKLHERAVELVEGGLDVDALARDIADNVQTFKDATDVAVLQYGAAMKEQSMRTIRARIDSKIASGQDATQDVVAYIEARGDLEAYIQNIRVGKGVWSEIGRMLNSATSLDHGDFMQVVAELKALAGGRKLSKRELSTVKTSVAAVKKSREGLDAAAKNTAHMKAEEALRSILPAVVGKTEAKKLTSKIKGGATPVMSLEEADAAISKARDHVATVWSKMSRGPSSASMGIPLKDLGELIKGSPELASALGELLRAHFIKINLSRSIKRVELNRSLYTVAKKRLLDELEGQGMAEELGLAKYGDISDDTIDNILAQYYDDTVTSPKEAAVQAAVAEGVEANLDSATKKMATGDVKGARAAVKKAHEAAVKGGDKWQRTRERLAKEIADLDRQIAEGKRDAKVAKEPRAAKEEPPDDIAALLGEVKEKRSQLSEIINRKKAAEAAEKAEVKKAAAMLEKARKSALDKAARGEEAADDIRTRELIRGAQDQLREEERAAAAQVRAAENALAKAKRGEEAADDIRTRELIRGAQDQLQEEEKASAMLEKARKSALDKAARGEEAADAIRIRELERGAEEARLIKKNITDKLEKLERDLAEYDSHPIHDLPRSEGGVHRFNKNTKEWSEFDADGGYYVDVRRRVGLDLPDNDELVLTQSGKPDRIVVHVRDKNDAIELAKSGDYATIRDAKSGADIDVMPDGLQPSKSAHMPGTHAANKAKIAELSKTLKLKDRARYYKDIVDGKRPYTPPSRRVSAATDEQRKLLADISRHKAVINQRIKTASESAAMRFLGKFQGAAKAFNATMDVSWIRQGITLALANPKHGGEAYVKSWLGALDKAKAFSYVEHINEHGAIYRDAGLHLYPTPGIDEMVTGKFDGVHFNSTETFLGGVPGLKQAFEFSDTHYGLGMNILRTRAFDAVMMANPNMGRDEMRALAHVINVWTGRGFEGGHGLGDKLLNNAFFSIRNMWANIMQTVGAPFAITAAAAKWGVNSPVTKMYIKMTAIRTAYLSSIYLAANLYAQWNEESPVAVGQEGAEWGQLQTEAMNFDPSFGHLSYLRLIKDMVQGMWQNQFGPYDYYESDTEEHYEGDVKKPMSQAQAGYRLFKFFRYKAGPTPNILLQLGTGEDAVGRPVEGIEHLRSFLPFFWQSSWDILKPDNVDASAAEKAIAVFLGAHGMDSRKRYRPDEESRQGQGR